MVESLGACGSGGSQARDHKIFSTRIHDIKCNNMHADYKSHYSKSTHQNTQNTRIQSRQILLLLHSEIGLLRMLCS